MEKRLYMVVCEHCTIYTDSAAEAYRAKREHEIDGFNPRIYSNIANVDITNAIVLTANRRQWQ